MTITLLSSKRQLTIPKSIAEKLKLAPRTRVALYPQKDALVIKPLRTSITEQTAGSLARYIPANKRNIPFSVVMEETRKIVAKELAKKL